MIKLFCGDCLEIMPTLESGSVDMVLCDLPYGTTACKWDSVLPLAELWHNYWRLGKNNAPAVLTCAQPFTTALIGSQLDMFGYCWIWVKDRKTGQMNAKIRPMAGHEEVAVFYRARPVYNRQLERRDRPITAKTPKSKSAVYGLDEKDSQRDGYERRTDTIAPDSVIYHRTERGLHPTQKPVALMEYLIRTYTNPGDVVLDNCMGSGTTGVACVNTGRSFIGIEKDPAYFAIAESRINGTRKGDADVDTRSA